MLLQSVSYAFVQKQKQVPLGETEQYSLVLTTTSTTDDKRYAYSIITFLKQSSCYDQFVRQRIRESKVDIMFFFHCSLVVVAQ